MSATGPYTVQYDPKALKELTKLDKPAARRILKAIDALSGSPRPSGARPLVGYPDLWRIRVGDYRVVYTIKDAELVVLALRVASPSLVTFSTIAPADDEDRTADEIRCALGDSAVGVDLARGQGRHLQGAPGSLGIPSRTTAPA